MSKDPTAGVPEASSYATLEGRILRNTGWVALGMAVSQLASLLSMLVLARLLEPKAFGLVALAWTVLYYVSQIQESGLGAALIHRRGDVAEAAASALLYTWAAGLVLYAASFAAAPLAASLFHSSGLTSVLRLMALVIIFRSLGVVPGAILERELDFRSKTLIELAGTFAQVGVFLALAFAGLGVWSLVAGNVAAEAARAACSWLRVPWRPSPRLAKRRVLLELVRYGRFVGATNIFTVVANTADNIAVGRLLGTTALGFYSVAFRLANFPNSVIGFVLGRTMFSVYSRLQHDRAAVRRAYVQNLERVALLAVPASVLLAIAARPVVLSLLGERWLSAVTPLRILGVYGLIKSFGGPTAEALKGIGKPHVPLVAGIAYAVVVTPLLFVLTPPLGTKGTALSMLIAVTVSVVPQVAVYTRSVELPFAELARALGPPLLSAAVLAVALGLLVAESSSMSPVASLVIVASVGLGVYLVAVGVLARNAVAPIWVALRAGRR